MAASQDNKEEITGDPGRQQAPGNGEGNGPNERGNIPNLFVLDLNNTCLADAIANDMALNERKTEYMICCPKLKEHIGVDTLTVSLPRGKLEVPTDPPVRFIANCAPTPFDQPDLLVSAMRGLREKNAELAILPGDELPVVSNRYLTCWELLERLSYYVDLSVRYGESVLRFEGAQLLMDTDNQIAEELNQEILMHRISNILDKITSALLKDTSFRRKNKKVTYSTPKINHRATTFTSMEQLHEMKTALEDELKGIMQVAFIPQPEAEVVDRIALTPGEDIPDDTGRPREERRRLNLTVATNT